MQPGGRGVTLLKTTSASGRGATGTTARLGCVRFIRTLCAKQAKLSAILPCKKQENLHSRSADVTRRFTEGEAPSSSREPPGPLKASPAAVPWQNGPLALVSCHYRFGWPMVGIGFAGLGNVALVVNLLNTNSFTRLAPASPAISASPFVNVSSAPRFSGG